MTDTRASGQTPAEEVVRELSKEINEVATAPDPKPLNLTRAFSRMRTDWHSPDRDVIERVQETVRGLIFDQFRDAYALLYEIWDIVREPETTADGEIVTDSTGFPVWKKRLDGSYIEDWTALTHKDRERILGMITTRMFDWEQSAADIWGEALFAKTRWEEAFATGFESDLASGVKDTVDVRTAHGNRLAAEDKYFAVYKSYYSRKADAIVRSLQAISQRMKDVMTA